MNTPAKPAHQVWTLEAGGHSHTLSVWGTVRRRFEWQVDGVTVADHASSNEKTVVKAEGHGRIKVRFSSMGAPRRATLFDESDAESAKAMAGIGGTDMIPVDGSPAAKYERRLRRFPTLYPLLEAGGIVAGFAATALLAWLVSQVNWPEIPWPAVDLPDIPWPDIPWPDIPWPDITLPGWLRWVMEQLKYVVPVIIAYVVARAEVRRRRRRDDPPKEPER